MKSIPNLSEKMYRQREGRFTALCADEEASRLLGAIGGRGERERERIFYLPIYLPTFRAVAPFHFVAYYWQPRCDAHSREYRHYRADNTSEHSRARHPDRQRRRRRHREREAMAVTTNHYYRRFGLPACATEQQCRVAGNVHLPRPPVEHCQVCVLATRTGVALSPLRPTLPHPTPPRRYHRRAAAYIHVCVYSGRSPNG